MRTVTALLLAILLMVTAAFAAPAKNAKDARKPAKKEAKPVTEQWAVIETNKGTIKFKLYEKDAPITSKNFIDLANRKFYDGVKFHRVVPGFVIQGGDPTGTGRGGSEKTIKREVTPKLKHDAAGVVAMARKPEPDSATSQFYITLDATPQLDMEYAVFGRVTEGLDVVKKIEVGDVMKTVRIVPAPEPKAEEKK